MSGKQIKITGLKGEQLKKFEELIAGEIEKLERLLDWDLINIHVKPHKHTEEAHGSYEVKAELLAGKLKETSAISGYTLELIAPKVIEKLINGVKKKLKKK